MEKWDIEELRGRIDIIDDQLLRLLNVRVACAVEVGRHVLKNLVVRISEPGSVRKLNGSIPLVSFSVPSAVRS